MFKNDLSSYAIRLTICAKYEVTNDGTTAKHTLKEILILITS